jgi:hypothetical protein
MALVRRLLAQLESGHIDNHRFQVALATLRLRERIEQWEAREATYQAMLLSNGQRHRKEVG